MCEKRGSKIDDESESYMRNVHPSWIEEGEPSSQAFRPGSHDDGCMSVDRASLISSAGSFGLHTGPPPAGFGLQSAGVWEISHQEVGAENVEPWEDAVPADQEKRLPANAAHAVLEFTGKSDGQKRSISRRLKERAITRGRRHPA